MRRQDSRTLTLDEPAPRENLCLSIVFPQVALAYHIRFGNEGGTGLRSLVSGRRIVEFRSGDSIRCGAFHIFRLPLEARPKARIIDHKGLLSLIQHLVDFAQEGNK